MTGYFDLTPIIPPKPNDPVVNEASQLNANWTRLDLRLFHYRDRAYPLSAMDIGQEFTDNGDRFGVWDGTQDRFGVDGTQFWTDWTTLPLQSAAPALNNGPKWRRNTATRKIEMMGNVLKQAGGGLWPSGMNNITFNTSGIPDAYKPFGGKTFFVTAAQVPGMTTVVSGCYLKVYGNSVSMVQIDMKPMGQQDDFMSLDGVSWWY